METIINFKYIIASILYSGIGIFILLVCYVILDAVTPKTCIWKELSENKNIALAIFLGAFMVGVSIIVSSAIHS